jgi:hypothetical protein
MLLVVKEFDIYTFPWTLRALPKGAVPIPMLLAIKIKVFETPDIFIEFAKMF